MSHTGKSRSSHIHAYGGPLQEMIDECIELLQKTPPPTPPPPPPTPPPTPHAAHAARTAHTSHAGHPALQ